MSLISTIKGLTRMGQAEDDAIAAKRKKYWDRIDGNVFDRDVGHTLMPFQREGVEWLGLHPRGILADDMGLGKGQPSSANVLTPTGWRAIGTLSVGDEVIGSNGRATRVSGVFPRGRLPVYRVTFTDDAVLVVDADHLWSVTNPNRLRYSDVYQTVRTADLIGKLEYANGIRRAYIPLVAPVQFEEQELLLDPYLVGVLLGDGGLTSNTPSFSSADKEIVDSVSAALPDGVVVYKTVGDPYSYTLTKSASVGGRGMPNPLTVALRKLGMWHKYSYEKSIPDVYKFASVESRTAVLQGLLDTDGTVTSTNSVSFSSSSFALAQDVQFLVQSLGGVTRIRTKKTTHRLSYRMTIRLPNSIRPFRLSRKSERFTGWTKYHPIRAMKSIEAIGEDDVVCISVEAPDQLYVTEHCIVTHNTLQALASVVGADAFPCLFITQATLRRTMEAQVTKWTGLSSYVMESGNRGASIRAMNTLPRPFYICHYEGVRAEADNLRKIEWKSIIVDEATNIKNRNAQRTKAVKSIKAPRITLLSGTPLLNSPIDLWSLLNYLNPNKYSSYWAFEKRYCILGGWQGKQVIGYKNVPELKMHVQASMLRRRKDEVLKDLPPKTYSDVFLDLPDWQRKAYNKMHEDLVIEIRGNKTLTAATALAKLTRLKQVAVSPQWTLGVENKNTPVKLEAILEILDERVLDKTLVFTMYATVANGLAAHLAKHRPNMKVYLLTGATELDKRGKMEAEFQALPATTPAVWISTITAGGMGLTLTAADTVVFMDKSWVPKINEQAEDRAHRIGQKDNVNVISLIARDTVEEQIERVLKRKLDLFNDIVEKDGGFDNVKITFDDINDMLGT